MCSKKSFRGSMALSFIISPSRSSNTAQTMLSSPNSGSTLEIYCSNMEFGEMMMILFAASFVLSPWYIR